MIDPETWPPAEVDALLDDHEDEVAPVDSAQIAIWFDAIGAAHVDVAGPEATRRAGIWSGY